MQFSWIAPPDGAWLSLIGWLYLLTNATRVLTYIPQIVVVWRCNDGARSISLFTWASWVLSNLTATVYGVVAVRDVLFVAISLINLIGCGTVVLIATRRRLQWRTRRRFDDAPGNALQRL